MRVRLEEDDNVEVSMAPLLDCIFLLLIFFLVATTFERQIEKEEVKQLQITLPDSAVALTATTVKKAEFVITVDRHGRFMLNDRRISTNELHAAIKALAQQNPNQRVRIDGDRNTPLQHIVHLLDLCEFEGLNNIGIRAASDAKY